MALVHYFGGKMVERGKGGVVLMASIAGLQGSGFLATYAATKAFNRVFAGRFVVRMEEPKEWM